MPHRPYSTKVYLRKMSVWVCTDERWRACLIHRRWHLHRVPPTRRGAESPLQKYFTEEAESIIDGPDTGWVTPSIDVSSEVALSRKTQPCKVEPESIRTSSETGCIMTDCNGGADGDWARWLNNISRLLRNNTGTCCNNEWVCCLVLLSPRGARGGFYFYRDNITSRDWFRWRSQGLQMQPLLHQSVRSLWLPLPFS